MVKMEQLNIAYLPLVTAVGLKSIVESCLCLQELHVQGNLKINHSEVDELMSIRQADPKTVQKLQIFARCNK